MDHRLAMGQDPEDDRNDGSDQPPDPVTILVDFAAKGSDLVHDVLDEIFIAHDLPDDEFQEGRLLRQGGRGSGGDGGAGSVSAQEVLKNSRRTNICVNYSSKVLKTFFLNF